MRFLLFLAMFIIMASTESRPHEGFKKSFRYWKITCSSSNKTCSKPFCYIKNTRNDSTYSAGCDFVNKNVTKLYLKFGAFKKGTFGNNVTHRGDGPVLYTKFSYFLWNKNPKNFKKNMLRNFRTFPYQICFF